MTIGTKVENHRYGVSGTDIPIGARVRYYIGVDRGGVDFDVEMVDGKKMLDIPVMAGYPPLRSFGQMGVMEVISLPDQK